MAITQTLIPIDQLYQRTGAKIILNKLNAFSMTDQETLSKSIMTVYDNVDVISTIPQCDCGAIKGRYLLGTRCHTCGTECKELHEKVDPILWLEAMDKGLRFLNPGFWMLMSEILDSKKLVDWLRWLCDPTYSNETPVPPHIQGIYLDVLKSKREYNNTMLRLRDIMVYILNIPRPTAKADSLSKVSIIKLIELYDQYTADDILFSTYLPIVNKKLFVMENTAKGKFVNLVVSEILDIVLSWVKSSNAFEIDRNLKKAGIITAMAVSELSKFFSEFTDKYILKKSGLFRKHVYGSRGHFTFRCVIVSISGPHDYDEIHIPWAVGVTVLRPMLLNKLRQRGVTYKASHKLLMQSVKKFDPLINELLLELLAESPLGKLPVISQRNPSLTQSSALLTYITKVKTDVDDKTVGISSLVCKLPNADFDGDEHFVPLGIAA